MNLKFLIALLVIIFVMSVICSCRSVKYIPGENIKTKMEYIDRVQRDSVHVKDNVFMLVKGDTVFRDRFRVEYRNLYVRDTINVQLNDTIRAPYPVEVVKNKVPCRMWWLLIALAAFTFPSIIKIVAKFKGIKF